MSDQHPKDKAEEPVKKLRGRKPPEYRAFEEMLKTVIKSPPMKPQKKTDS